MKKKWLILLAILTIAALTLTGCGVEKVENMNDAIEDEEEAEEVSGESVGGWQIVEKPEAAALPEDVKKAFDAYATDFGESIVPMGYIGTKTGDSVSYMVLCKDMDFDELQTLTISNNTNEDDADSIIYTIEIGDYTQDKGAEVTANKDAGSWQIPNDYTKGKLPEDVQKAFAKATEKTPEGTLTPVAYLGSQVVSGTNYAILCCGQTMAEDSVSVMQIVTVYQDLEGNAEITNTYNLDLAEFGD